jgi:acetyl esterase
VLSVDYWLAPEHKASTAVGDAYAAFQRATKHAPELGVDIDRIAVGRDIAAVVSMCGRDDGGPMPRLKVLIYPATDMAANTRSRTLFGDRVLNATRCRPVRYLFGFMSDTQVIEMPFRRI